MKIIKYERPKPEIEKVVKKGLTPTERPNNTRLKQSDGFTIKHNTIEGRVKQILKQDKYSRRDDLWLLLLYYVKCNMIKIIVPLEDFKKIHKPESITRAKRHLFSKAKEGNKELQFLLRDKENLDIRDEQEKKYKEYFGGKKCQ